MTNRPFAYFSAFGGVEVVGLEYDINDYIVFIPGAWGGCKKRHRARIHYDAKRPFFIYNGARLHLDEAVAI